MEASDGRGGEIARAAAELAARAEELAARAREVGDVDDELAKLEAELASLAAERTRLAELVGAAIDIGGGMRIGGHRDVVEREVRVGGARPVSVHSFAGSTTVVSGREDQVDVVAERHARRRGSPGDRRRRRRRMARRGGPRRQGRRHPAPGRG